MKNRKRIIATLVGMSLTSQILPSAYTIVANAQTKTTVEKQVVNNETNTSQNQKTNGLAENKIHLYGALCQEGGKRYHETVISFTESENKKTVKLKVDVQTGAPASDPNHPYSPYHPGEYLRMELVNCNGDIKKQFILKGNDNINNLKKELESWNCGYGDYLRISHDDDRNNLVNIWSSDEMLPTKIDGKVTDENYKCIPNLDKTGISREDLNKYDFRITTNGLQRVIRKVEKVSNQKELIAALEKASKAKNPRIIKLEKDITIEGIKELVIPRGVTIDGKDENGKNHVIDLKNQASITLKGDYIRLSFVDIKNCSGSGMQVYNSKNVYFRKVTVEGSNGYGIFSNGSSIKLQNCTTKNNTKGGILISKSLTLPEEVISNVTVIDNLTQKEEKSDKVVIKNLELHAFTTDKKPINIKQNNTFEPGKRNGYFPTEIPGQSYSKTNISEEKGLSETYQKKLNLPSCTNVTEEYIKYK